MNYCDDLYFLSEVASMRPMVGALVFVVIGSIIVPRWFSPRVFVY